MRSVWLFVLLGQLGSCSELGFSVGSEAASQLAEHAIHATLKQPRLLHLELRNAKRPWFEPIAHLDTKARLHLGDIHVHFRNNWIDLQVLKLVLNSSTDAVVLPLPFFLGEDVAHINAEIPSADIRFKLQNMNVIVDECRVNDADFNMYLDRGYFLNLLLQPLSRWFPSSLVRDYVCDSLSDRLSALRNRELPLISIVPPKARQYLHSKNSTLRVQLVSVEAVDEQLTLTAHLDWAQTAVNDDFPTVSSHEQDEAAPEMDTITKSIAAAVSESPDLSTRNLQLWVEDRLVNEAIEQFDWDWEWMAEDIAVNSDKLPRSTRDFLSVLCPTCYFQLRVSANGPPHVESTNHSLVLQKSDRIFMKVVNPTINTDSVVVSFYLTLTIQLIPEVNEGVFRTQVNLISPKIRMEEGAFPSAWNSVVQDLVQDMIMDVIWPGLKKEIEALIYSDGLKIPANCGLEPASMRLTFDDGKFGVSSSLKLNELEADECLKQVLNKLPDPAKLLVMKDL